MSNPGSSFDVCYKSREYIEVESSPLQDMYACAARDTADSR